MKPITFQTTIDSVRARVDRSLGMSISTSELTPEHKVLFMELQGILCECTIRPIDNDNAPEEIKTEMSTKTPSQRLRNTLFVWWKQLSDAGKCSEPFELWYPAKMENIIIQIKLKIDDIKN